MVQFTDNANFNLQSSSFITIISLTLKRKSVVWKSLENCVLFVSKFYTNSSLVIIPIKTTLSNIMGRASFYSKFQVTKIKEIAPGVNIANEKRH